MTGVMLITISKPRARGPLMKKNLHMYILLDESHVGCASFLRSFFIQSVSLNYG